VLSAILCSIHNVHFYQSLMRKARAAIDEGSYEAFAQAFMRDYAPDPAEAGSSGARTRKARGRKPMRRRD
jgi:queuine tRNA-ribosyltransferase